MAFITGQSWCVLKSCSQVGAQNKDFGAVLQRDWTRVLWHNIIGRDPFNQKFRKFRSKTQWIGSVQPEKFRKNWWTFWGGPQRLVGPVWSKNDLSIRRTTPTHSHAHCLTVQYILGVYPSKNGGFSLLVQLLWHNCTQPGKFSMPPVSRYCR